MKKFFLLILLLLSIFSFVYSETFDFIIEPGKGIGRIKLNMDVKKLKTILREPDEINPTNDGYLITYTDLKITLSANKNNKITSISVFTSSINDSKDIIIFKTKSGVQVGMRIDDAIEKLKKPTMIQDQGKFSVYIWNYGISAAVDKKTGLIIFLTILNSRDYNLNP